MDDLFCVFNSQEISNLLFGLFAFWKLAIVVVKCLFHDYYYYCLNDYCTSMNQVLETQQAHSVKVKEL